MITASSYFGGSANERPWAETIDPSGNIYLGGETMSADFPTTPGAFQPRAKYGSGQQHAFVAKLSPDAQHVLYATYVGGSTWETGFGITADAAGDAFLTGTTCSRDFPTTAGAYQRALAGGCDAYVTELNPQGTALVASTLIGGKTAFPVDVKRVGRITLPPQTPDDEDLGLKVALGPGGRVFLAGETNSTDFPTTSGAYQTVEHGDYDAFVSVFSPDLSQLEGSTYLGGEGYDYATSLTIDAAGDPVVAGETQSVTFPTTGGAFQTMQKARGTSIFVARLNAGLSSLIASTYISGASGSSAAARNPYAAPGPIVLDGAGDVYLTGETNLTDYPTTGGVAQPAWNGSSTAFVTALTSDLSGLVLSTYLGGSDYNGGFGLALGPAGDIYVSGYTSSTDFPVVNAFQPRLTGGRGEDAFVARLDPGARHLVWSSFLGGSGNENGYELAQSGSRLVLSGFTQSTDFPTRQPFQAQNGNAANASGNFTQTFTGFVTALDEAPAAAVPEAPGPGAWLLPVAGILALAGLGRRRRARFART